MLYKTYQTPPVTLSDNSLSKKPPKHSRETASELVEMAYFISVIVM
jgi:hypothetical protein